LILRDDLKCRTPRAPAADTHHGAELYNQHRNHAREGLSPIAWCEHAATIAC
jgi:hypothetical protein